MKKRIISLLLSAVMLFSLLPTTAFAGNDSIELSDHATMLLQKAAEHTGNTLEEAIEAVVAYLADPTCYDYLFKESFDETDEDVIRAANALIYVAFLKTAFCLNGFAAVQNAGFDQLKGTINELPPVAYELLDLFDAVEQKDYANVVVLAAEVEENSFDLYAKVFKEDPVDEPEEVAEAEFLADFTSYITNTSVSGDLLNNTKKASEQYAAYIAELCGVTDPESLSKFRQYADDWAKDEGNRYMLNYYGNLLSEDEFSALQEDEKQDYINRTLTGICLSFFDSFLENHFTKHGEHFSLETAAEMSFVNIMRDRLDVAVAHKESMLNLIDALSKLDADEKYPLIYEYIGEIVNALSKDYYNEDIKVLYTDWDNLYLAMQGKDVVTSAFEVVDTDNGREIKLLKDINCAELGIHGEALSVEEGKSIVLDLNGHKLDRNLKAATEKGSVIIVNEDASLTVQDGSAGKTGKITGGMGTADGNGNVKRGGGVYVVSGTFVMNGGTIAGCSATKGGGVCVEGTRCTFTMNGGTISQNTASYSGDAGGGVYIVSGCFTMKNGAISGNNASAGNGGGVNVCSGASFRLEGGKIESNTAAQWAGGVCNWGTFTMTDGTIFKNTANSRDGGGVSNAGTAIMTGGTIKQNTAATNGGGFYNGNDAVTLGGTARITDNVVGGTITSGVLSGGTTNNLYLESGKTITISTDTAPTGEFKVGVTTQTAPIAAAPVKITTNGTADDVKYFFPDSNSYYVMHNNGVLKLAAASGIGNALNLNTGAKSETIANAINTANVDDTIRLLDNFTENVTVTKNITLDLNGKVLSGTGTSSAIMVNNNGNLTLIDSNSKAVHNGYLDENGLWKLDSENAHSEKADEYDITGGVITGGAGTTSGSELLGGGVYVYNGTLTMNGGTIAGCSATNGGGVYVYSGTFTMNKGSIVSNTANSHGGGIFVGNGATVNILNGTIKENNSSASGGAAQVDGKFTMSGGTIQKNHASGDGGGLSVKGTVMLNGAAKILNNSADGSGGAVNYYGGSMTLGGSVQIKSNVKGGTISNGELTGGIANNVCLFYDTYKIAIGSGDNAPTSNMSVGITLGNTDGKGQFTAAGNGTAEQAKCFSSDNLNYAVNYNSNNTDGTADDYLELVDSRYDITYKDQGPANFSGNHENGYPTEHTYGEVTTLKTATKIGYTFGGWYANSDCTGDAITSLGATDYTADITLYAKWTRRSSGGRSNPKPVVPEFKNPFVDIFAKDYFYDSVLWAAENNITSGVDAIHFSPSGTTTRGQMITFLWRMAGSPVFEDDDIKFVDIKKDDYFYDAVVWGWNMGIVSGKTATAFAPDDEVTRGEAVTFIYRYAKVAGGDLQNPFNDVKQGAFYYYPVLWAANNGITAGTNATHFTPNGDCTRGQIVTFLYRYNNEFGVEK